MKSSRGENVLIRDAIKIFEMIATGLLDRETDRARSALLEGLPLVLRLDGALGPDLNAPDELDRELLEAARGSRGHQRGVQLDTL
jgi:hypothetical protein